MEELDLRELWNRVWEKRMIVLAIIAVFILIGIIYTIFLVTPKYTSKTTMVLTQASSTSGTSITQSDIAINSKLVSTYATIMTSDLIVGETVENLDIDGLTAENLKKNIKVSLEQDSEVINIAVTNENPNNAAEIANELAKVFSEKIVDIFKIENLYIVDKAVATTTPSNINHVKDILIFMILGIVVSGGYIVVDNILDTTIKSEDDVEKMKGLVVIGVIPMEESQSTKKRRKSSEKGSNSSKKSKFAGRRSI